PGWVGLAKHMPIREGRCPYYSACLAELNKIKEVGNSKRVRKRAASVQRRLRELFRTNEEICELSENVQIILEAESPNAADYPELNSAVSDDQLIAAVLYFCARNNETAALVTDDSGLGLLVKARRAKITVIE